MEIKVKKKTLFYFPTFKNNKLEIYDERNNLFYSSDFVKNFKGLFYLPKGIFKTSNRIVVSNGKLTQPKVNLPKPQFNRGHNFSEFEFKFGENKNKASIFHDKKLILIDNSFKKKPYYQLMFIIFHEFGHNYSNSEHYADLYAVKRMLESGFNPSQIIHAIDLTLTDSKSIDRKLFIYKLFNKYYGK